LNLLPTLKIKNCLPYNLELDLSSQTIKNDPHSFRSFYSAKIKPHHTVSIYEYFNEKNLRTKITEFQNYDEKNLPTDEHQNQKSEERFGLFELGKKTFLRKV
jgi:hypothetical protein